MKIKIFSDNKTELQSKAKQNLQCNSTSKASFLSIIFSARCAPDHIFTCASLECLLLPGYKKTSPAQFFFSSCLILIS